MISRAMIGSPLTDFAPVGTRPARRQGFNLIVGNTRVTGSHQLRNSVSDSIGGTEEDGSFGEGDGVCTGVAALGMAAANFANAATGVNADAVTTTKTAKQLAEEKLTFMPNFNAAARLCRSDANATIPPAAPKFFALAVSSARYEHYRE
jgi:hypothetical protein